MIDFFLGMAVGFGCVAGTFFVLGRLQNATLTFFARRKARRNGAWRD